jgi:hypothetical protein
MHAVRADVAATPLAPDPGLPISVPVATRCGLRLGWPGGGALVTESVLTTLDLDALEPDLLGRPVAGPGRRRRDGVDTALLSSSTTSPKIVCLKFSQVVAATVMKNCEPLVPGPALAIASRYGRSKLSSGWNSSLKV